MMGECFKKAVKRFYDDLANAVTIAKEKAKIGKGAKTHLSM